MSRLNGSAELRQDKKGKKEYDDFLTKLNMQKADLQQRVQKNTAWIVSPPQSCPYVSWKRLMLSLCYPNTVDSMGTSVQYTPVHPCMYARRDALANRKGRAPRPTSSGNRRGGPLRSSTSSWWMRYK